VPGELGESNDGWAIKHSRGWARYPQN